MFFFFSALKTLFHCLSVLYCFQQEVCCYPCLCFSVGDMCYFSPDTFKILIALLKKYHFDVCIGFFLHISRACCVLSFLNQFFHFDQIWKILASISSIFFLPHPYFVDSSCPFIRPLEVVSELTDAVPLFLSVFVCVCVCSCSLFWNNFYCYIFRFTFEGKNNFKYII